MEHKHKLGWVKDHRDERDYLYPTRKVAFLPDEVDLSSNLMSIRDQNGLGECVGFGIMGNVTSTAKQLGAYTEWFSPDWAYAGARMIEGTLDEDSGAYPRDALDFLLKNGCLLEHYHPFDEELDTSNPLTWTNSLKALDWKIDEYQRCVDGIDGIKSALADGHFVSIGVPWYESWFYPESDGSLPEDYSIVAGGHEVLVYGYSNSKQKLLVANSWGKEWGVDGKCLIPYSAVENWKFDGGYDAHYVKCSWGSAPEPVVQKKYIALSKSVDSGATWKILLKVRV